MATWKCEEYGQIAVVVAAAPDPPAPEPGEELPTARFVRGKYRTDDPRMDAALAWVARQGYAPIFADDSPDSLACPLCQYATTNPNALQAHLRAKHKGVTNDVEA